MSFTKDEWNCGLKTDIEMYSTHHEGKSVVSERLIITLKNNIHKNMTPISKNVYINKLDDKVNIYSHILHSTTNTCNLFM